MKNIRTNVFETNSSSSHSITISKSVGVLDTIAPDMGGNIVLTGGNFGWEWRRINDPLTKANYCACDAQNDIDRLEMLKEVIQEHTGCNVILDIDGYIDHESIGNSSSAFESKSALRELIFNPKSYIFTGNYNDHPPPNFYDIDKDYKFVLGIDGSDLVGKLATNSDEEVKGIIESIMCRHQLTKYPEYSFGEEDKHRWRFNSWEFSDIDGNNNSSNSSLMKIEDGIIVLFKIESVYDYNDGNKYGKYIGNKIIDTKEINFRIREIEDQ